jgi:glutamate 5-kinase
VALFVREEGNHVRRIVIKIGSSNLVNHNGALSEQKVKRLVHQLVTAHRQGCQIILVSSGAVAAGIGELGWDRLTLTMPEKQAAAAVGQSILIQHYQAQFAAHRIPVAQLLLTRSDIEDRKRFIHIQNTIEPLLHHGIIPIINENDTVTVEEIRFGDNDTLGALVSLVSAANLYVMLSDINGLYTANPRTTPDATFIPQVETITADLWSIAGGNGSTVGTGGMKTKLQAAEIATQSGVAVRIANGNEPNVIPRIIAGESIGTHFHAKPLLKKKRSWIAYGAKTEGNVVIDTGAFQALTKGNSSLLLAGITATNGEFLEGAVVAINYDNTTIGKGICRFSRWDLDQLIYKRKAGEQLPLLPEVIHRDQLVLLSTKRSAFSC